MGKYIIGIDGGTQSTKISIYDLKGNVVCKVKKRLKPLMRPRAGVAEHPEDDLWDSLKIAAREVMRVFPYDKKDIIGLGLCSIRCCWALLNRDGKLVEPVISWMDTRYRKKYENDNPEIKFVTTATGYLTIKLTGEHKDTAANYRGYWPIDYQKWNWIEDREKFRSFNIKRDMLMELVMPGTVLGNITKEAAKATGFPEGLPVIATANDKAVEALGAGLLPGKTGLISLGTYITSMVYGSSYEGDIKTYWTNCACIPNHYLYEAPGIGYGMSMISWFIELLGDSIVKGADRNKLSPEEFLDREAEKVPPGCYGLMTVPHWFTLTVPSYGRGIIFGFEPRHKREHIYRSILEGIAFTIKINMIKMVEKQQREMDSLIISGGGSNSNLLMKIFADVFGMPVSRNKINESVSLGSAISVAVGLGYYKDYSSAIESMVAVKDNFKPNGKNHILYNNIINEVFKDIALNTEDLQKRSYEIFCC